MRFDKIEQVSYVLGEAEKETKQFAQKSGLYCNKGCGHCCLKPDIEATPLEFLPAAYYLHKTGKVDAIWDQLQAIPSNESPTTCVFYKKISDTSGYCSEYEHRGLICRLFGFSSNFNKYGQLKLITCKFIKQQEKYQVIDEQELMSSSPILTHYYMALINIDISLGQQRVHINDAIKKAIELMGFYFMYHDDENPNEICPELS